MNAVFISGILASALAVLFSWAFRNLPRERWQILAAIPSQREPDGTWRGLNLTYYGAFNALGVALGVSVAIFFGGTMGLSLGYLVTCILVFLALVLPASRIVNRIVEGHWHGFTVGGGCFVGLTLGPWLIMGLSRLVLPANEAVAAASFVLGALAPAYALGEGVGRLACISFGCCYGRPLDECSAWIQRIFVRMAFVFEGRLKKASYAHGFGGRPLLPIQAITSVIFTLASLIGIPMVLWGRPLAAFVITTAVTQIWRFISEFQRADYRGRGRISPYQWMALVGALYALWLAHGWPTVPQTEPDIGRGLALLWSPGAILMIETIAVFVFLRMGLSTVTTARIAFSLWPDRIQSAQQTAD